MIVVVSAPRDLHAAEMLNELQRRGAPATLLDLSDFPQRLHLTLDFPAARHRLAGPAGDLDLSACRVVWWRRPQPYLVHPEVHNETDRAFAYAEADAAFSGLWLALDAFWINHPTRDQEASHKVYQLDVAREMGLRIPRTCITSNPDDARAFVAERGPERTIYKAFAGTETAWRETRLLRPNEAELLDQVCVAPVIFQEYIAGTDLRITVAGEEIFPAAIRAKPESYPVDFRMTMDEAAIEPVALPPPVLEQLHAYMRRLGLVYGAIDMRVTPEGEYVFLEINPSGQWLFIEHATRQPITAALAEIMMSAL